MKPRFMLDTNICIYLMKHQPPQVRARFADCFVGDVVISAITLAELEFGVARSGDAAMHNQAVLDSLLEDIPVAPFDRPAARAYGPLRAADRERSKDALDELIASHAMSLGATRLRRPHSGELGDGMSLRSASRSITQTMTR